METYLETGALSDEAVRDLVARRRVFPCYFGSALRLEGVEALLNGLARFAPRRTWPGAFAARVYKIARDGQGRRLTFLKVTGGTLHVRDALSGGEDQGQARYYTSDQTEQFLRLAPLFLGEDVTGRAEQIDITRY